MARKEYASYTADHDYVTCPKCGGVKTRLAELCRSCSYESRVKSWTTCADCGKRIRHPATRCLTCYDADRAAKTPTCVDCGKPTKQYAYDYHAQRCWPCEVKQRRNKPVRYCTLEGCGKVHASKGLCRSHYQATFQRRRTRPGGQLIQWLKTMPCQICGYSLMKSEAARLIPGGPYRPGNVMALCVRCHREVDAGITPAVTPPTSDEILAWAASKGLR